MFAPAYIEAFESREEAGYVPRAYSEMQGICVWEGECWMWDVG